jgi:hypothetical protein
MEKSGIFSLVEINDKESLLLLEYMRKFNKSSACDFIHYLIGMEYLKFLDLLAGTNLKVPSRKSLYRDIEYIKIYNYVREKNFEIDSIRNASKVYGKSLSFVRRAIIKISRCIGEKIPYTLEELNSIRLSSGEVCDKVMDKDGWAFEDVDDNSPPLSGEYLGSKKREKRGVLYE